MIFLKEALGRCFFIGAMHRLRYQAWAFSAAKRRKLIPVCTKAISGKSKTSGGNIMKKLLALSLALLLVFAAVVPAFAATSRASCDHTYRFLRLQTVYTYLNSSYHNVVTVYVYICTKCGYVNESKKTSPIKASHKPTIVSASCDGTTQTRTMRCSECYTTYDTYVYCPRGPHSGNCPALPV